MSQRFLGSVAAAVVLSAGLFAGQVAAQSQKPTPKGTSGTTSSTSQAVPRTAWGAPDLNGVWTGNIMTPLERSEANADKPYFTPEEVAAQEKRQTETALVDTAPAAGNPGTYNNFWTDPAYRGVPDHRTSLIVDPPNGRIPYTPEGRKIQQSSRSSGPYNTAADMDTGERCITDGIPVYFNGYNNNYEIFQTKDYVVVLHEYYHEARIVPLDGGPHGTSPQWLGDARGRWEGDTLVVDSTNFADKGHYRWSAAWRAARPTTHLIERFTRKADSIEYSFTLEDSAMYTQPWTAKWPLSKQEAVGVTQGPLYEYACHEGNHAMVGALKGERAQEKAKQSSN